MSQRESITIAAVEAKTFHRLTFAQVEHVPSQGLVRIQGKNGSGKSSLLRAIMGALGGASEVQPDPIHEGAETGEIRVRLTNGFTIVRRFTEASEKGYLTVVGPDGGKHGQGRLAEWLGTHAFDPAAFFALTPERQRSLLFSLGTDPRLPQKLAAVKKEHAEVYERRTPVISRKRHLRAINSPEGERPQPIDTSAEMERLQELQAQERAQGDLIRKAKDAYQSAESEADRVSSFKLQIANLEAQLKRLREGLGEASASGGEARAAADRLKAECDELPDLVQPIADVQARLQQASDIERAIEPWRRWDEAQAELGTLEQEESDLTSELGALKTREGQLLQQAGIPVDELSFGDYGRPLLHGRPLEVASGAERVRVAVQVAMAADPDLRVILLDEEANGLDEDAITALAELAKAHGFQVWMCLVRSDGASEVVVVDGEARDREPAEVPT